MKKMCAVVVLAAALPFGGLAAEQFAWADVPKCAAWKLPDREGKLDAELEWHEMAGGDWFTNSVGEKISIEHYCAALNCEGEREAVPMLDRYYVRCQPRAVRLIDGDGVNEDEYWMRHYTRDRTGKVLRGDVESQKEVAAWRIAGNVCLRLDADDTGRMSTRMYRLVLFDGKQRRHIVDFDSFPEPRQMDSILALMENPDAVNNLAVMILKEEAWKHNVDSDYAERLLRLAASFGSATACENLAALGLEKDWSKARIERWRRFAAACREAKKAGIEPKMELDGFMQWPKSYTAE